MAKGYGLPNHERDGVTTPTFRLRAVVKYYDTSYIENIKIGDCVYAFDENAKKKVIGTVEDVFVSKTNQTISLFVNGHKIESTAEHPYYVVGNGWVSAEQISCGDVLLDSEGKCIYVEKVEKTVYKSPVNVYNFRVKDYHTYFVSSTLILA